MLRPVGELCGLRQEREVPERAYVVIVGFFAGVEHSFDGGFASLATRCRLRSFNVVLAGDALTGVDLFAGLATRKELSQGNGGRPFARPRRQRGGECQLALMLDDQTGDLPAIATDQRDETNTALVIHFFET